MRRRVIRVLAAAAVPVVAILTPAGPAPADPGVVVYPGMEIRQDTNLCTLGYVEPEARMAFTAGHCRGSGPVRDRNGADTISMTDWVSRLYIGELT